MEKMTIEVLRYNPEVDSEPHLEKYEMMSQDSYELGRTIGVTGTPSAILIETGNPRGITTYMFRGAVSKDALQSKLNELKEIAKENK